MQTFVPYSDPVQTAKVLDRQRLGKQRIEAIQIARSILGLTKGWANHPAVRMWKKNTGYLVNVYLVAMMNEWSERGYSNEKSYQHYLHLKDLIDAGNSKPVWMENSRVLDSHKAMLVRKKPDYYGAIFGNAYEFDDYVWPV